MKFVEMKVEEEDEFDFSLKVWLIELKTNRQIVSQSIETNCCRRWIDDCYYDPSDAMSMERPTCEATADEKIRNFLAFPLDVRPMKSIERDEKSFSLKEF